MERLITVKDVKERYKCSNPTARKYIRACNPHMEDPLATTEDAFQKWELSRMVTTKKRKHRLELFKQPMTVPRKRGQQ